MTLLHYIPGRIAIRSGKHNRHKSKWNSKKSAKLKNTTEIDPSCLSKVFLLNKRHHTVHNENHEINEREHYGRRQHRRQVTLRGVEDRVPPPPHPVRYQNHPADQVEDRAHYREDAAGPVRESVSQRPPQEKNRIDQNVARVRGVYDSYVVQMFLGPRDILDGFVGVTYADGGNGLQREVAGLGDEKLLKMPAMWRNGCCLRVIQGFFISVF